jgi:hypothetical protein
MTDELPDPRLRKVYGREAAGVIYETYLVE